MPSTRLTSVAAAMEPDDLSICDIGRKARVQSPKAKAQSAPRWHFRPRRPRSRNRIRLKKRGPAFAQALRRGRRGREGGRKGYGLTDTSVSPGGRRARDESRCWQLAAGELALAREHPGRTQMAWSHC